MLSVARSLCSICDTCLAQIKKVFDYRAYGSGNDPGSCSQPAADMSHKPGARPEVTLATLERAATNFAA